MWVFRRAGRRAPWRGVPRPAQYTASSYDGIFVELCADVGNCRWTAYYDGACVNSVRFKLLAALIKSFFISPRRSMVASRRLAASTAMRIDRDVFGFFSMYMFLLDG